MDSINFKIDYNSVKTTNPEMRCETLARKSRYWAPCTRQKTKRNLPPAEKSNR